MMYSLEPFQLDLKGLDEGSHRFEFSLSDEYFAAIEAPDIHAGSLSVALEVHRAGDFFELDFHTEGKVVVPCDLCLDDMEQPIVADNHMQAKFGEAYSEEDEQVTVPGDKGILDISWFVYEFIVLALPIRHVHAPGACNPAMLEALEAHSVARDGAEEATKSVDPRWEKLEQLKLKD